MTKPSWVPSTCHRHWSIKRKHVQPSRRSAHRPKIMSTAVTSEDGSELPDGPVRKNGRAPEGSGSCHVFRKAHSSVRGKGGFLQNQGKSAPFLIALRTKPMFWGQLPIHFANPNSEQKKRPEVTNPKSGPEANPKWTLWASPFALLERKRRAE